MLFEPPTADLQPDLRAFDPDKQDALTLPYRNRSVLFLGDGNLTYSHGLCRTEDSLHDPYDGTYHHFSAYVVTTEFKTEKECMTYEGTKTRLQELNKSGALCCFNIDARQLEKHFPKNQFKIIFFNCPDQIESEPSEEDEAPIDKTAELVEGFFTSASLVQEEGARICMTLIQPNEPPGASVFYQAKKYNIIEASKKSGYTLVKMRTPFDYQHQKTKGFRKVEAATDRIEFLFRKGIALSDPDEWVSEGDYLDRETKQRVKASFFKYPITDEKRSYFAELKEVGQEICAIKAEKEKHARAEESSSDDGGEWGF